MNRPTLPRRLAALAFAITFTGWTHLPAQAQERQVYRCPGNVYTDQLSSREAQRMGCKTLDGMPVTVVQPRRSKPSGGSRPAEASVSRPAGPAPGSSAAVTATPSTPSGGALRVDANDQRARDSDARRILESELRKEEEKLGLMRKEFNSGEPERRGDERNFAKYQERVGELKAAIARKEADVAALRRELSKLGNR